MGYIDAWKVLDAMITDFRKEGGIVPPETMVDLRSAKTLISVLLTDPDCVGIRERIEECLFNVESYVMAKGQTIMGIEYIDNWSKKLDEASRKVIEEPEDTLTATNEQNLATSGLPRGPTWIRITPIPGLQVDKLKELADASHLSYTLQNSGCLVVSGENDQLKKFVKNVASIKAQTEQLRTRAT